MWAPCCSPRRRTSRSSPSSARNVWSVAETSVPTLPPPPHTHTQRPLAGSGWGTRESLGEGGGRGTAGGAAAGQASSLAGPGACCPRPAPRVQAGRARSRLPELLENKGMSLFRPAQVVRTPSLPLQQVQTLLETTRECFFVHWLLNLRTGSQHWPCFTSYFWIWIVFPNNARRF